MSVLVFAESPGGKIKKAVLETVTYAAKTAAAMGTDCIALTIGNTTDAGQLGKYGASKVYNVAGVSNFDSQMFASIIIEAVSKTSANVVILTHSSSGKSLTGRLAAKLNAGCVSGVNSLPDVSGGFKVKKNVFSGKSIAEYEISSYVKILSVMGNSLPPEESGAAVEVEIMDIAVPAGRITVKEVKTVDGVVPLPEAELVVSAGRGMKGPENWGMVEELAGILGAATACSRPVSDMDWRPHHEHVGQTGITVSPNLYIAIGISGAIQHLAGVSSSKTIVVINNDADAPFFSTADYGIVGDAFEVVPRLNEALKKFKEGTN